MKSILLILTLVASQNVMAKVIKQTRLSDNLTLTHHKTGILLTKEWKELSTRSCVVRVPKDTSSKIQKVLIDWGYLPVENNGAPPQNDELEISDIDYNSFVNSHGCAETHLKLTLSYGANSQWRPFTVINDFVACIAGHTWSTEDLESLFYTELMPRCEVRRS